MRQNYIWRDIAPAYQISMLTQFFVLGINIFMLTQYAKSIKNRLNSIKNYVNTLNYHVNVLTVLKYVNIPL